MFGSPDAYGNPDVNPGNKRFDTSLRQGDLEYNAAVKKAQEEGFIVQSGYKYKRVPDASSPSGTKLVKVAPLPTQKYSSDYKPSSVKPKKTPPTPQALDSGMTNNSGVTPVVAKGGTSPSFRAAVEQGADSGVVPGTLPASVKPSVGNMANSSELERYKVFVKANPEIAKRVKPGQAGYEEIQAILGVDDSFGKTPQEVLDFNTGKGTEVLIGFDDPVPTGRNTSAPVPGDIPQKGTAMGSSNVNLTPATKPEGGKFTSVALAGTEGAAQQRDLTAGVPSVEPIADALDQSRAVTVDQSPAGKEFFNKYFNRTFGR